MALNTIVVTGSAGFIGFHLCKRLLEDKNIKIIGIDNLNDYYNPILKEKRNEILKKFNNYEFCCIDIGDYKKLEENLKDKPIDIIIHLAAQAGVRYSLKNPWIYERSNILGTLNLLEISRKFDVDKFILGSSSSVYGSNEKIPFSEVDRVDKPVSLYACTKRSCELMIYTYHHLYGINSTILRFFTVYGEFGRPDMSYFKFVKNMFLGKEIEVYNYGKMERDFTYVSDIVDGIISAMNKNFGYEIFNLGNSNPVKLEYFIELLEKYTGITAKKKFLPLQKGDVLRTYADISKSEKLLNYRPKVKIEEGLKRFVDWFKENRDWLLKI